MAGRKTKLTKQVIEDFCGALSIGATYRAACANADIVFQTFRNWQIAGEAAQKKLSDGLELSPDDKKCIEFLESVEEAENIALLNWQQTIDKSARLDPAWAWKMLQVRAPNDYSMPQQKVDVTSNGESVGRITTIEVVHHPPADNATASRDT